MIQKTRLAGAADELEEYRLERIRLIKEGLQPIALEAGAKVVLHVVPADAFENANFDLTLVEDQQANDLKPMAVGGWGPVRFNFDGPMMVTEGKEGAESYVQVFHNGIVEAVSASYLRRWDNKKLFPGPGLERMLMEALSDYAKFQSSIGVTPPLFVMLSLLGLKGYRLIANESYGFAYGREIDRDDLLVPAVEQSSFDTEIGQMLRPVFNRVWNAAGYRKSWSYDDSGIRKTR